MKKTMTLISSALTLLGLIGCSRSEDYTKDLLYMLNEDGETYSVSFGQAIIENGKLIIPPKHNGKAVTNILEHAFYYNLDIVEVTIPSTMISLGHGAFDSCENLKKVNFNKNSKLEVIPGSTFSETGLEKITIPKTVKSIGVSAFDRCASLTEVIFEKNAIIKEIDSAAFSDSININNIVIPKTVMTIEMWAFDSWTSEQTIYCESSETFVRDNWHFQWNEYCDANIVYDYIGK